MKTIAVALKAVAVVLLSLCLGSTAAHALSITGRTPTPNAIDAAANSPIQIVFDADINAATVDAGSVVVTGSISGRVTGSYVVASNTVTFTPDADLRYGEVVSVTVTTGVRDTLANPLASPVTWQFYVAPAGGGGYLEPSGAGSSNGLAISDADVGDVDGDGDLDVITNFGGSFYGNYVFVNDGAGVLWNQHSIVSAGYYGAAALGDLDDDGDLDAAFAQSTGAEVHLNDGAVAFSLGQALGGGNGQDIALGDLDGDGDLDAFVVRRTQTLPRPNDTWFNDGVAGFSIGQSLGNSSSDGVALGDLDGDGDLDAFVANDGEPNKVWLNNGSGTFADSGQNLGAGDSIDVELGDLDGDGDLDAVVANERQPNAVWINDGAGGFSDSGQSLAFAESDGLALGDIDADGDLDIVEAVESPAIVGRIWQNDGAGVFTGAQRIATPSGGSVGDLALADLDADGDLDAFFACSGRPVFLNGDAPPLPPLTVTGLSPGPNELDVPAGSGIAVTFNHDIYPPSVTSASFVVTGSLSGPVSGFYLASGNAAAFSPVTDLRPGEVVTVTLTPRIQEYWCILTLSSPVQWQFTVANPAGPGLHADSGQRLGASDGSDVALADLDGDGDLDAFVANTGSSGPERSNKVWLNDGLGFFTDSGQNLGTSSSRAVSLGDVDGDGDVDAFVANSGDPNKVWLNDGSGTFSDSGQNLGSASSRGVALGDLDRDGDLDAWVANLDGAAVWMNNGSGVFADSGFTGSSLVSHSSIVPNVALGDLDRDGDLDAFLTGSNGTALGGYEVWLNDGSGGFTCTGTVWGQSTYHALALGDVDGDGDLDALGPGIQFNNGSGVFTYTAGVYFGADMCVADVDGDGDLDCCATSSWGVALNNGSGLFTDSGQTVWQPNYEAYGLALGDLDGDGDLDAFAAKYDNLANEVWFCIQAPQAVDDAGAGFTTDEDTPLDTADVLANDSIGEAGHILYLGADTSGLAGLLTDYGDGTFTYDPNGQFEYLAAGESATDTFTYTIEDLGTGGPGTVTITVWGLNDTPDAVDDTGLVASEDLVFTSAPGALLTNDTDVDVADLRFVVGYDATSSLGAAVTVGADGTFVFDPTSSATLQALASGDSTNDTFGYTISDAHGATDTASVTITVDGANDAPVAVDDDYPSDFFTDEDTALVVTAISVLDNDADVDGGVLVVSDSAATSTFGATVTVNADGTFTYDPTAAGLLQMLGAGESITDSFTYTVGDGQGGTTAATVYVTVDGVDGADDGGQTIVYQTIEEGCGAGAGRPGAGGPATFVLVAALVLGIALRRRGTRSSRQHTT